MASRGCLFVFEGLDRAGKTTQAKLLAAFLQQHGQVNNAAVSDGKPFMHSVVITFALPRPPNTATS